MSTPSRRRPTVPPLSELDAPGRTGTPGGSRAARARARRTATPSEPTPGPAGTDAGARDLPPGADLDPTATDPPGGTAGGARTGSTDAPGGRAGTAGGGGAQSTDAPGGTAGGARTGSTDAPGGTAGGGGTQTADGLAGTAGAGSRVGGPDDRDLGGWERGVDVSALWASRSEVDEADQRAVAAERAALARAVLAEQAAATPVQREGRRPLPALAVLAAAAVLLAARLWLVGTGALFGTGPVRALDAAIAVTAALGLVLVPAGLLPGTPGRLRRPAAVLGVPVLLVAGTVLLQPVTPAFAPAAACPAAPVRGGTATAVTTAPAPTRAGPGRGYPSTGLLPAGCAVGITGYCLGDGLPAAAGWTDNRWLLVGRQRGPAALVSRHVSGEPERPRFLPAAVAAPTGELPLLPGADCGPGGPGTPGPTRLDDVNPRTDPDNLLARAPGAANVGFAVWVAPDPATGTSPLIRGGQYQQVPGGTARPAGLRWGRWDYRTLLRDLRSTRPVTVAVLAIGCTAPAAPAGTGTAGVTTYEIVDRRLTGARQRLRGDEAAAEPALAALDVDRLAAEACAPPR